MKRAADLECEDEDDDGVPTLVELSSTVLPLAHTSNETTAVPDDANSPPKSGAKIPVSLLTGFLGSGKTTLLNYILSSHEHKKKIAVIENEFSEGLGIESMIAKSGVSGSNISDFFELPNGCICCTIKNDLLSTLEQLVLHRDKFDYIIIETTGLANPGPVISTFWTDEGLDR